MKEKNKKQKKINLKKFPILLIILVLLIYFIFTIISLFLSPTDTFTIKNGEITLSEELVGYVIREETLFQGNNYKNGISQIKAEGERVSKGDPIFRYYTNNEDSLVKKIEELDIQIEDAMKQQANIPSGDITALNLKIEEKLKDLSKINNKDIINEYKKDINEALIKKAKITGELSPSGSYLKSLINKRSEYEEQLNSGSEYIESTESGIVSYKIDGLEEILTPNCIETLTEDFLKSIKVKTGEVISSNSEKGKIVNNYYCYLATIVDSENVSNLNDKKYFILELSTGDEIRALVYKVIDQEDGSKIVVFKISNCVEKLINYRKISFEIIWWSSSGLRVPNSAVIEENGRTYIIRTREGYTDKIFVKVLKSVEDYCIIDNYTSAELKELGFTIDEIRNNKSITVNEQILINN